MRKIEVYFKFLGMIVTFCMCSYIGFYLAGRLNERYKLLQELESFTLNLRGEINYKSAVLEEAFLNSRHKIHGAIQKYMDSLCEKININKRKSMDVLVNDEEGFLRKTALKQGDIDEFKDFLGSLGNLDKQMQLAVIDMYIEKLKISKDESKDEIRRSSKMYKCMGVFVGMMVCIFVL